jgi:hypothetical protein
VIFNLLAKKETSELREATYYFKLSGQFHKSQTLVIYHKTVPVIQILTHKAAAHYPLRQ